MPASLKPSIPFVFLALSRFVRGQNKPRQTTHPVSTLGSAPVAQAMIVYDLNQGVRWLANANLAEDPAMPASLPVTGINPNGTMDYGGRVSLGGGCQRVWNRSGISRSITTAA